jgi:hypothetical protein
MPSNAHVLLSPVSMLRGIITHLRVHMINADIFLHVINSKRSAHSNYRTIRRNKRYDRVTNALQRALSRGQLHSRTGENSC